MIRLRGLGIDRASMQSWLGWPVPAELRVVSGDELTSLARTAEKRGFSRRATHIRPRGDDTISLLPYLYEGSPEASWTCLVIHVGDWRPPAGSRPEVTFDRLDIALVDFRSLRRARRRQRDQLLHWTAWLAARPRTVTGHGAETTRHEPPS